MGCASFRRIFPWEGGNGSRDFLGFGCLAGWRVDVPTLRSFGVPWTPQDDSGVQWIGKAKGRAEARPYIRGEERIVVEFERPGKLGRSSAAPLRKKISPGVTERPGRREAVFAWLRERRRGGRLVARCSRTAR
jgi:hypothetical protein